MLGCKTRSFKRCEIDASNNTQARDHYRNSRAFYLYLTGQRQSQDRSANGLELILASPYKNWFSRKGKKHATPSSGDPMETKFLEPTTLRLHCTGLLLFQLPPKHVRVMKPARLAIPRMRRVDLRLTRRTFLEQLGAIVDAEDFFGLDGHGPRAAWANSE
jgi:hypothetical protein